MDNPHSSCGSTATQQYPDTTNPASVSILHTRCAYITLSIQRNVLSLSNGVQLFAKSHGSCFFSFYYSEEDARLTLYGQKKPSTCTRLGGRRRRKKRIPMLNFSFNVCPPVLGNDVILFTKRKWKKKKRQRLGSSSASPQTLTDGEKNDNNIERYDFFY